MSNKRENKNPTNNRKKRKSDDQHSVEEENNVETDVVQLSQQYLPAEAEAGIIESVTLENFMCHDKLEFSFGPNVNFIIGRNGSGKSAILTGLVLGLGGKANATSRGQNVKSFIKTGKNYSIIEVRLRNSGSDAYRPDDFGTIITIERRINVDGQSTYKLKNDSGRTIANKKDELIRVLDQFNIQVDNPVSILNQETSRNFLNSTSGRDKYKFFQKATQLEEITIHYKSALEKQALAQNKLEKKQEMLPALEKEMKMREQEWIRHQTLGDQRKQLDQLRKEFVWAIVMEKEKESMAKKQDLEELSEDISSISTKIQELSDKIEDSQTEGAAASEELNKIVEELNELKPQFTELKKEDATLKLEKQREELKVRKIKKEIDSVNSEKNQLSTRIQELKTEGEQDFSEEKRQRQNQIEETENEKQELQARLTTTQNHNEQLKGSVKHYETQIFNFKQEDRIFERQIQSVQINLANIEASRTDRFRRYGQFIPDVLNAIKKRKFRKQPKGPIGAYIEVKDPSLALAVEACIGGILTSFFCDNAGDEKTLQDIFERTIPHGKKPSIIVGKFTEEVYDVRCNAVRCNDHVSLFNAINVSDPAVINCLIDQFDIEGVLLVKDTPSARHLMMHSPPPKCLRTYTASGETIFPSPDFRFYSSNRDRAYYLTASVDEQVNELNLKLDGLKTQRLNQNVNIREIEKLHGENLRESTSAESQLTKMRQRVNHLNLRINKLKNIEDPEPTNFAILEEELEELNGRGKTLEEKFQTSMESYNEIKEKCIEVQGKIKEIVNKSENFHTVSDPLKERVNKQNEIKSKFQREKGLLERKFKDVKTTHQSLKKEVEKIQAEAKDLEQNSSRVCERVFTEKSRKVLEREISELQKHIEREERQRGKKEDVLNRFTDAKEQFVSIKFQISEYEKIITNIKKSLERRIKALKLFRSHMEARIKYLFLTSLSTRGYKGKIVIDHKHESLSLLVQPSEDVTQLNEDMRSLSGGERSFSTVCFILSLWDAMESPFRILDEYDVFMDMVNRRLSMGMMLETAYQKSNHQFIFLTPLDMPITKKSANMKICRMPDPERGHEAENED